MKRGPRQAKDKEKWRAEDPVATEIGEPMLRKLASHLGPDWEKLGTFLDFKAPEISGFRRDHPWQTEDQAFHMLVKWKQRRSTSEDQIGMLSTALQTVNRVDLSDQLRRGNSPQEPNTPESCRQPQGEDDGPRCQSHRGEVTRFFCETCQVLICRDCTVSDHCMPQHDVVDSEDAAQKYRKSMKEGLPSLKTEIEKLQKSLAENSKAKQVFIKEYVDTKEKIQKTCAREIERLKAEEKRLIDDMKNLRRERDKKFEEQEKKVRDVLQSRQDSLRKATEMITAPDSVFLSHYPETSGNWESLSYQATPQVDDLSHLSFKPSRRLCDFRLGELKLEAGKWELHREFGRQDSGTGEPDGARGIAVLAAREVVLAEHLKERLVIFSMKGQPQKTIPVKGKPFDVAAFSKTDRLVVVDNTRYVKVFTGDTLAIEFPTVPQNAVDSTEVDLRSVAVKKDGTIVVGDVKRKVLTEHKPTDGALIRTIPVKTKPYFLAVDDKDRIVVSGIMKKVYVTDDSEGTVFPIKPIIDGQRVKQCNGVCCNSSGIYVAMNNGDRCTGHIHHYDDRGGFLGCVARDLHLPLGMAFSADGRQLAVADWSGPVMMYHRKL